MPSAQTVHWAKLRVATLSVSSLAILSVLLYLLSSGSLFRKRVALRVYVPDATGMVGGNPVRLNGIEIGKIEAVRLSGSSDRNRIVEVRLAIDEAFLPQIPQDSVSAASADNLLGDKYIDITKGKSRESLAPGGELRFQAAQDIMKQLDIEQFEKQLRTIDQLLTDIESGKNAFGIFLTTDDLYRNTVFKVAELEKDIRAAAATTGSVGQFLYRDTHYRDAAQQLRQLDKQLQEIQNGAFLREPAQYENLRGTLRRVRQTVASLKSDSLMASDALYRNIGKGLAEMIRSVDDFNAGSGAGRLLVDAQPYEALNGSLKEWQESVREFRTNPRKFLFIRLHLF